jgi:hypothetical protein
MNHDLKTVKCRWCGINTTSTETGECDGCWELCSRIEASPDIAKKMIKELIKKG